MADFLTTTLNHVHVPPCLLQHLRQRALQFVHVPVFDVQSGCFVGAWFVADEIELFARCHRLVRLHAQAILHNNKLTEDYSSKRVVFFKTNTYYASLLSDSGRCSYIVGCSSAIRVNGVVDQFEGWRRTFALILVNTKR
jgi:hypothetical protein